MKHQLLLDYEFVTTRHGYVVRALIRLEGQAPATSGVRVPLNLSLVLDRSGSMHGEKLAAARDAAAFLVRRLAPEDRVTVVAYDGDVLTVADEHAPRAAVAHLIQQVEPGGSTNLSGGWLRGRELVAALAEEGRKGAMNRVLLLTDGQANMGITDPQTLTGLCASAARAGVTTTTVGFGADYDEALLRAMADAGGGSTYYIERPDQAPGVFEEEIEGLLSLAAQNVAIEVRPSEAVQLTTIWHDYPSTPIPHGRRIELGDIYAREPKSLILEFFVPTLGDTAGVDKATDADIASLRVTADVLTAEGGVTHQTVTLPVRSPLSAAGHSDPVVQEELLLVKTARAREESLRRREDGDSSGASDVLREMASELRACPMSGSPMLSEQAADLDTMALRLEHSQFDAADAKYVAQRAYNTHRAKRQYEEKLQRKPGGKR
jgi:Ca-activated chloride channel family protein